MKIRNIALFSFVAALALPVFAGPQKAGKWQTTMQTEMSNMPVNRLQDGTVHDW